MNHRQLVKQLTGVLITYVLIEAFILIFEASNYIQMESIFGDIMFFLPSTAFFLLYAVIMWNYIKKGNPRKFVKVILRIISWGCFLAMEVFLFLIFTCIMGTVV